MPNSEFSKTSCRHCGGHIAFPPVAAGQSVACPHCGQPTELMAEAPPVGPRRRSVGKYLALAVVLLVASAGVATLLMRRPPATQAAQTQTNSVTNVAAVPRPVATTSAPVPPPAQPQPAATTNNFAIMPYKLEKTPGSSLQYVIGTVQNRSDRQRFGVKVEFSLFDTNGSPVGSATDYQPLIEPHATWHFKAMVMASKTATARFRAIAEDQ